MRRRCVLKAAALAATPLAALAGCSTSGSTGLPSWTDLAEPDVLAAPASWRAPAPAPAHEPFVVMAPSGAYSVTNVVDEVCGPTG